MAGFNAMSSLAQTSSAQKFQAETGTLLNLAWPLLAAQLAQMSMGVVDTVMSGRVSSDDLAGVSLGGSVMWPVMMLIMGVLQAVTPSVSQLNGANRHGEIGEVIRQALYMAAIGSVVIVLILINVAPLYTFMEVDPDAVKISVSYLKMTAWGMPAVMGYFVLRFLCEGMGYTRPAMVIAVSALLLKIPLNLVFIHGYLGMPAMGGVGCGVATAIVMWFEFLIICYIAASKRFDIVGWHRHWSGPNFAKILTLLKIGAPIGATMFFEMGMFSAITILLGRYGSEVVAAHTIAMNLGGLTFMFPLALGMATTIRVGFKVGSGDLDGARLTSRVAILLTVVAAVFLAMFVVTFRAQVAGLYTSEVQVLALATSLMAFVAVYQLFDNIQATVLGALRGYKDTQVPMIITLVGYWVIGIPLGCLLGFGWFGEAMGVYGFWVAFVVSLATVAVGVCCRLWWLSRNPAVIHRLSA
jgi:MATE family multidrug resistance protein